MIIWRLSDVICVRIITHSCNQFLTISVKENSWLLYFSVRIDIREPVVLYSQQSVQCSLWNHGKTCGDTSGQVTSKIYVKREYKTFNEKTRWLSDGKSDWPLLEIRLTSISSRREENVPGKQADAIREYGAKQTIGLIVIAVILNRDTTPHRRWRAPVVRSADVDKFCTRFGLSTFTIVLSG